MTIDTTPKMSWWNRLSHPGQFVALTRPLVLPLAVVTAVLFAVGLWYGFFSSPPEKYMGDTVRIMYVHVPTAWLSQFVYATMAVSALGTLMIPIVGVLSSMLLLGERPTWQEYLSMALVIAAIATVVVPAGWSRQRARAETAQPPRPT